MKDPNIICLLASHLNCQSRINNFNELLDIIHLQSQPCKIHISLSADLNIDNILHKINKYDFSYIYILKKNYHNSNIIKIL